MIVFINLKGQISNTDTAFAFFDTTDDTFCSFGEEQVFSSKNDFIEAYNANIIGRPLSRFLNLIPDNYFESQYLSMLCAQQKN